MKRNFYQDLPRWTLATCVLLALVWGRSHAQQPAPASLQQSQGAVATLDFALTVMDLERSIAFFVDVLDCELIGRSEHVGTDLERLEGVFAGRALSARLRLGEDELELIQWLTPESRPYPPNSRAHDRWFQHIAIVVSDMPRAYARLRERRVAHLSSAPQRLPDWNPGAAGIEAFYFRDPDQHALELISFPAGKGDPRWVRARADTQRLFLGIDHSAIVVSSTSASMRFWQELLGYKVAGTSENYGPEQAQLNAVPGAHLWITGLRPTAGPGVEFLEYRNPLDGLPYPATAQASDLVHWETRVYVPDLEQILSRLAGCGGRLISSRAIVRDGKQRALVRDPDGHAVELVGPIPSDAQKLP